MKHHKYNFCLSSVTCAPLSLSLSLPTHIYKYVRTISSHASTPDWCLHAQTRWQTLNALWHAAVSQLHLNKTWHNSDTCWATETWTRPFSFRQVGDCACELKTVTCCSFSHLHWLNFFQWDFSFFFFFSKQWAKIAEQIVCLFTIDLNFWFIKIKK